MLPYTQTRLTRSTRQDGAALLILLVIVIIATTGVLLNSLSRSSVALERGRITAEALAQAKEALIGRAVRDDNRPGSLPCPDLITNTPNGAIVNIPNDGIADALDGNDCPSYIGRLPWKTLGLPDLRDGHGERLWYALSTNFTDDDSRSINSDTRGTITVRDRSGNIINNGTNTTGAIAVIIAPGAALTRIGSATPQDRSAVNVATNYLDLFSVGGEDNANFVDNDPNGFTNGEVRDTADPDRIIINDRLLTISANDLFPPVEKAVAKRTKALLDTYSATWGAFPFAAPFNNPATADFTGAIGSYHGLLPVGTGALPTWAAVPTASFSGGSGTANCLLTNGAQNNSGWRCDLSSISGTPTITISGVLNGAGRGLWRLHDLSNKSEVSVRISGGGGPNLTTDAAISPAMNATVSVGAPLNAAGAATVVFAGTVSSQITRIELHDMQIDTPAWFKDNNWKGVIYYAVSSSYVQGGSRACNPPTCLTVNGSGGGNDKGAIIVMTGPARAGQTRPSAARNDYLEGQNLTPDDFIYENQTRSDSFNDHVLTVSP